MNRDGHRLQHGRFGKRKIVRQAIYDAGRNSNIFGKSSGAAVVRTGDSQNLPAIAQIHLSAAAGTTSAAIDRRIERDSVAHCESLHFGADRSDSSCGFMPHDNGRDTAPRRAIIAVDVATADAAGSHAHQDFTGTRRRFRKIGNLKMLVFGKQKNFHARLAPIETESLERSIL